MSNERAGGMSAWGVLTGSLSAGIPVGTGLGLIVSVLFVALEPNLWPALPLTFLRVTLCFLPAFALVGVGTAGVILLLPAAPATPGVWRARYVLGALLPAAGVLAAILFFALPVRFYVPGIRGLVLSLWEFSFPAAFFLLFLTWRCRSPDGRRGFRNAAGLAATGNGLPVSWPSPPWGCWCSWRGAIGRSTTSLRCLARRLPRWS